MEVASWPLAEGLICYVEILKVEAARAYHQEFDWYVNGKIEKKPKLPRILRDA